MEIRITGQQVKNITAAYQQTGKPAGTEKPVTHSAGDRVDLSTEAKHLLALSAAAQGGAGELPAVREKLVASLKERIAGGNYQIDPRAVAERMWRELKGGSGDD